MRIRIYSFIILFFVLVLISSLAYLQIAKHEKYKIMSEENRLKIVPLMAPRGSILDANGDTLVKDVLSFNVAVLYGRIKDVNSLSTVLSEEFGEPVDQIKAKIKKARWRPFSPVSIIKDIGTEKAIQMEELASDYPGLMVEVTGKRRYVYGKSASAVLGYLGLLNRPEFERLKQYGYRINDLVGKSGIEKQYDTYLRGTHGGKQIEVDHRGREMTVLGYKEPVVGKDVQLTIDAKLQNYCDELLEGNKGAIVVMDPETGAVRVMASAPGYDPNIFIDKTRSEEVYEVLNNKEHPLLNRAISGVYPLGSVFKGVVALTALETESVPRGVTYECTGSLTLGRKKFRCWKKRGHGVLDIEGAIQNSCNVFFFHLGLAVTAEKIAKYAKKFGFGERTGIDIPAESKGTLPSPSWKKKKYDDAWYKGDTVNFSIGQGYLLCSPLQVARMMSVFANGGYLVKPYLVERIAGITVKNEQRTNLHFSKKNIDTVRNGFKRVVNARRGTGVKARLDDVVVAGKTGTAQTGRGKNHGWFAGFAPFDNPKLTVVVFDEYGGKGGYYAAKTAGKVFDKALKLGLLN